MSTAQMEEKLVFCKVLGSRIRESVCRIGRSAAPVACAGCEFVASSSGEAFCIGCGCSDGHACVTPVTSGETSACSWLKVDRELGIGVCSSCGALADLFDDWQRHGHSIRRQA